MTTLDIEAAIREDVTNELLAALAAEIRRHPIVSMHQLEPFRLFGAYECRCACGQVFRADMQVSTRGDGLNLGQYSAHLARLFA